MALDLSSLDLDGMGPGSVVTAGQVEALTGVPRRSRDYPMACLAVREALTAWFRTARGVLPTVVVRQDDVCVLAPREAAEHNWRMTESLRRRMRAAHRRNAAVDSGALTAEERAGHSRALEIQGRYVQALAAARRDVRPQPVPGNTRAR